MPGSHRCLKVTTRLAAIGPSASFKVYWVYGISGYTDYGITGIAPAGGAVMPRRVALGVLVLVVLAYLVVQVYSSGSEWASFDERVSRLVEDLGVLRERGVDVSGLVAELNRAISLAERGDWSGAYEELSRLESRVSQLMEETEGAETMLAIKKYAEAALLLLVPVVVYIALPRVYLLLWYRARRDWVVEAGKD